MNHLRVLLVAHVATHPLGSVHIRRFRSRPGLHQSIEVKAAAATGLDDWKLGIRLDPKSETHANHRKVFPSVEIDPLAQQVSHDGRWIAFRRALEAIEIFENIS